MTLSIKNCCSCYQEGVRIFQPVKVCFKMWGGRPRRVRERGEANMKAKIYKFSIENLIFSCMKLKVSQQTFKNTLLSTPFFSILLAISPSNLHLSIVKVTQLCPTLCDPMD